MPDRDGRLVAGRYRLRARLGSGGMGTVWRADDEFLERTVAIKEVTLLGGVEESSPAFQRTLREARTSARLRHPNIVTVHDVALEFGRPWIVMELVEGPSLAEVVERDGPLPDHRAVDIARQLLAALADTHKRGVLHRDVKPANVLLDEGRVVLTDFGIAAVDGGTALTATNQVIGSPQYLAPERVNGQGAGPPSDLWALGVTLYFAVTGSSPFQREDTRSVLAAVLTQDPPHAPGALGPLIDGLLRRDPTTRLTATAALALLARDTEPTRPVTPPPPPATPPARRGRMVTALAAVVALAAAVITWLAWPERPGSSALDRMAARGTIVIGVFSDQPGIGFQDGVNERWSGFDIEIAKLVAAKLGFGEDKLMFIPVDEYNREEYLASRAVDLVVAAFPITEETTREVSFAGPYLTSAPALLLRDGESMEPTSMRGHKVCADQYSRSAEELANGDLVDQSDIELKILREDCVDALLGNQVDAVYSDEIAMAGFTAARPELLDLSVVSTTSVEYGIGVGRDDTPLRDRLNGILGDALNDGTWRKIYDRTLGQSGVEPGVPRIEPS